MKDKKQVVFHLRMTEGMRDALEATAQRLTVTPCDAARFALTLGMLRLNMEGSLTIHDDQSGGVSLLDAAMQEMQK